jgi:hypothetical protein
MYLRALHAVFDLGMGAVLLYWVGGKLAELSRHDSVVVVWECLVSELRKKSASEPEPERAHDLTTAADAT